MAVLKLDDFIKEEDVIELNNKIYHYDLSFKAMIKFTTWSKNHNLEDQIDDVSVIEDLIKIMIKEQDFVNEISKLPIGSQTTIINLITNKWVTQMIPPQEGESKSKK